MQVALVALLIVVDLCGGVRHDGLPDARGDLVIDIDGKTLSVACGVKSIAAKTQWKKRRDSFKRDLQILLKHPPCKDLVLSHCCPEVGRAVLVEVRLPSEDPEDLYMGYFDGKHNKVVLDVSQKTNVMVDTLLFELFNAKHKDDFKALGGIPSLMTKAKKKAEIEARTSWEHLDLFEKMLDKGLVALEPSTDELGQGKFILPEMTAKQLQRKQKLGEFELFTKNFCETAHWENAETSKALPTWEMYAYNTVTSLTDGGLRINFRDVYGNNPEVKAFVEVYSKKSWKRLKKVEKPAAYVHLVDILKGKFENDADWNSYEFTPKMKELAKREEQKLIS